MHQLILVSLDTNDRPRVLFGGKEKIVLLITRFYHHAHNFYYRTKLDIEK